MAEESLNVNWNLNEAAASIPRMARKHQEICTGRRVRGYGIEVRGRGVRGQ